MASKPDDERARKDRRLLYATYVLLGLVLIFEPINALIYGIDLQHAVATFQWGEPVSWLSLVFNCVWPLGAFWVLHAWQRGRLTDPELSFLVLGYGFALSAARGILEAEPRWDDVGVHAVGAVAGICLFFVFRRQGTKADAAKPTPPTEARDA
ncbi:MAG: hypothetical protein U0S12_14900 [Fimbriimonadales bacterium]